MPPSAVVTWQWDAINSHPLQSSALKSLHLDFLLKEKCLFLYPFGSPSLMGEQGLRPVHWGCMVLVTGPPGKSLPLDFSASLTRSHTLSAMTVDAVGHHVGGFLSVLLCSCPKPIYVRPQSPLLPYNFGCLCFALRGLTLVSLSAGWLREEAFVQILKALPPASPAKEGRRRDT